MPENYKTALVIGGNGGIGSSSVVKLLDDGFNVVASYNNNKHRLEKIIQNPQYQERLKLINLDAASDEDMKSKINELIGLYGSLDIVVFSISEEYRNIRIFNLQWESLSNQLTNQLKSLHNLYSSMSDQIKSNVKTKFIVLLSEVCFGSPPKGFSHYVTAKYALLGFAKSLAMELSAYNSTVNMISPGMVETDLLSNMPRKLIEMNASQNPLGRNGSPEDIASLISFLASDKADYLNGINIPVNGGAKLN
jgi:3-oxoacyl-[acyl-carrier protein] reductase